MNLIERLGGYENSRGIREVYLNNGWSVSDVCKGFHEYFSIEDLDYALLEYRRQNKIYEVDDYVVGLSADEFGDDVVRITRLFEFLCVSCFEYEAVDHTGDDEISLVRHAKDGEIKAGRRL